MALVFGLLGAGAIFILWELVRDSTPKDVRDTYQAPQEEQMKICKPNCRLFRRQTNSPDLPIRRKR
jgi:hypothetical protein